MRLGILPLGRATFDVPFAEEKLGAMLAALDASGHEITGPRALLTDEALTRAAIEALAAEALDALVILQVTFTDAAATAAAAARIAAPLAIWAVPEPRTGGRLRLNAFCGLNLAAHALGLSGVAFSWAYADPATQGDEAIAQLLSPPDAGDGPPTRAARAGAEGARIMAALRGSRIARIGAHPPGFDTCAYDPARIEALAGVQVDALPLDTLFGSARQVPPGQVAELKAALGGTLGGLDTVDQAELDRSLALKAGLEALRRQGAYRAFAIRCWPEMFTEWGGAVCAPAGMMGEGRVPCACEADVYGALTQMVLGEAAGAPVFLTDVVDFDLQDDTAVIWHCGQAPLSMRDPEADAEATVHTNRRKPLLFQFPLRPGEITFARISQARGVPKMVLGRAEVLRRPMAFTGTSGVIRFPRPAGAVLDDLIEARLEHHICIAYGDHRAALEAAAAEMGLNVLEI